MYLRLKKVISNVARTDGREGGRNGEDGGGRDSVVLVGEEEEEESEKFHFYCPYFWKYH